jgi:hypothetical protein
LVDVDIKLGSSDGYGVVWRLMTPERLATAPSPVESMPHGPVGTNAGTTGSDRCKLPV